MTEEEQATETEISNKVRQGNPLWVQLCLHLTARREAELLRGGAVKALGPLLSPSSHHVQVEAAEAGGEDGGMNICNKIPAVSFSSLWL